MKSILKWFVVRRRVRRVRVSLRGRRTEYLKWRETARELVTSRLAHFNAFYDFSFGRIAIKNQKTCWGSCSSRKNLNFHYKIALLPAELSDYIIVHELCHLGEMNHSPRFWALVEKTMPDYKARRAELKQSGGAVG